MAVIPSLFKSWNLVIHSIVYTCTYNVKSLSLFSSFVVFQYRDDVFWLPQNMDFRGRVYPLPPHLTHISELQTI